MLSDNEVIDTVAAERCPETGLEPATHRLLVECSTIELLERKRKKAAEGDRFFWNFTVVYLIRNYMKDDIKKYIS